MATQIIKTVIQLRRATTAEWEQYGHIVPAAGEPCFDTELNTLKIGDGVKSYAELDAIGGNGTVSVSADGTSLILENGVFKLAGFNAAEVGAQPRKGLNGELEWYVPSTVNVDDLAVKVQTLEDKMDGNGEGSVNARITAKIDEFAAKVSDDGIVNTLKELVDYVADHSPEAADMAADILELQNAVGEGNVSERIAAAIKSSGHISMADAEAVFLSKEDAEALLSKEEAEAFISKDEAKATFEHVKYEISHKPDGTLVNYGEKEIRVMCPTDTQFVLQNSGEGADASLYYIGFKAYAPENAVSFKEDLAETITDDEMYYFEGNDFAGVDDYGRKYSIVWLPVAKYSEDEGAWTYYGASSSTEKYIGWYYTVNWYNADGVVIDSDQIRINLSNENCHNELKPYYMSDVLTIADVVVMDGGSAAG